MIGPGDRLLAMSHQPFILSHKGEAQRSASRGNPLRTASTTSERENTANWKNGSRCTAVFAGVCCVFSHFYNEPLETGVSLKSFGTTVAASVGFHAHTATPCGF